MMPFNDMYSPNEHVSYVGFRTAKYCTIYWLVNGQRQFKTVCYDANEMAYAVNNRTQLTKNLRFEIEYEQSVPAQAQDEKLRA